MKISDDSNLVLTNLLITLKNQQKRKYIEIKNNKIGRASCRERV